MPRQGAMPGASKASKPSRTARFDSDESDESERTTRQPARKQSAASKARRGVIQDDDDEDEDNNDDDDNKSNGLGEESEAEDIEDEADMTAIEDTPPIAKLGRKSKTRARSDGTDDMTTSQQPKRVKTPLSTPEKAKSSEAEEQEREQNLLPKTPAEQKSQLQLPDRSSIHPMMTPRTPRMGAYSTIPASQARSTVAPFMPLPPKIRLVIHKMVLRDFKSYAGEQIIGPFHKSFSAVVGPNGSGKSNVIDAMLFVFGWRANKMRQGKLSELIHNSAGRDNLPNCSVEVWFREIVDLPGPDDFKVVPNSRLIVARTAYRNNSSIYTLNGKKSNFTEVTTLLKTRGIDLDHKRFLILQGEVESIAQMPPQAKNEHEEGLLEYLEDIIGTSSYKTPIEEANKKVDEANELRGERLARLKIVQKEKDSLEPKKREAETYLRDQNELTQRQSALWQVYMMECRDEMMVATTSMTKLKQTIAEEKEKNAGSKAKVDALEQEFKTVSVEFDVIVKETEKIVKDLAKYEKEDVQLQEKRKHLETKRKKLTKSMADDKHASSEARSTLINSSEESEGLEKEIKLLDASLEKQESELDRIRNSLKGKTEKFSIAIEQKQVELQPWIAKITEKKNAREVAVEEKRLLSERFSQVAKEAVEAQKSLLNLTEANEAKCEEVKRLQKERTQQIEKAKTYEGEIKEMREQEGQLKARANSSRAKCEDAKASMQSNRSRGDILNSLTRQAELGMIREFHGRLGNLGVIDDKYDVAISTACPGLDNMVVDGVEHGQACIEHLRKNNLGRGNFVLLNSLAKMNMSPIQTPDNVPRLFDLVKPRDARFAPAFYHQLRDTLVARDLAQANKIAYGSQRWRVVTLDGQLIDKSGTMSGGGTKVARGAMSSKAFAQEVSLEQLSKLDKERQVNEESLQSHIKYTLEMTNRLEACRREVPKMEMSIEKIEMDLSNSRKMIQEAQKRIKELQQQGGPDDADQERIKDLDKQVSALDDEIEKLSRTSSSIETDISDLQEKILEAGGMELRAQNSKVDGIKERIELFGERMTKAVVAKTKAEKDLIKLTKSTEKNTEAFSGLEDELKEVIDSIEIRSQSVDTIRQKLQDSQDEMETKKEVRDEIKEQLDQHMESANAFRSLEMEIKQKLEENEKCHGDNEKRLKHWEEKHSKLSLQQIDSDEEEIGVEEPSKIDDQTGKGDEKDVNMNEVELAAGEEREEEDAVKEINPVDNKTGSNELQEYSPDELRSINKESIKSEIVIYEEKLQNGQGNLSVLQEYKKRETEFLARAKDLEQTTQERDEAKQRYDDLRKQRLESFMAGFAIISSKLKEMYQTITLGGNAELELVDSLDPFSEGILFSVMPPKKSWKNISNLSGGEKTLSSLALVFALHAFKPTPLYAMDELDAALDFRNVSIVANLIKERTKGAQFIVISLRNNMFELASRLVGIYKTNGQTKSLAVHNSDLHAIQASPAPVALPSTTITSRQANLLNTPRPSVPRGSMPTSMTTPSSLSQFSTLRKPLPMIASRLDSVLASPAPHNISQISQTPKAGSMIRGLGIFGSSAKLTSSQSIRGFDFTPKIGSNLASTTTINDPRITPLAVRRRN